MNIPTLYTYIYIDVYTYLKCIYICAVARSVFVCVVCSAIVCVCVWPVDLFTSILTAMMTSKTASVCEKENRADRVTHPQYTHTYIPTYTLICVCMYVGIYIYLYTYTYIYVYVYICICMCIYRYMFMCMYMYMYRYR